MDDFFSKRNCDRCGKMPDTKTDITVQLTGSDGNIFNGKFFVMESIVKIY